MNRRHLIAGVGSLTLAGLAGCLGAVGFDRHESSPSGVDASALENTGYERSAVEELVVEEDVGVAGFSERIVVTNHVSEYEKGVDLEPLGSQRAAVFIVLTTPQIGLAGRNFNPVEGKSTDELIALVEDNYDDIGNVDHEADDTVTILEQSTTVSRFAAEATFDGVDLDVDVQVTEAVETDDDLLVAIGVYPEQVAFEEESNVIELMEGIVEHVEDGNGDADDGAEADGGDDDAGSDDDEADREDGGGDDDGGGSDEDGEDEEDEDDDGGGILDGL